MKTYRDFKKAIKEEAKIDLDIVAYFCYSQKYNGQETLSCNFIEGKIKDDWVIKAYEEGLLERDFNDYIVKKQYVGEYENFLM